MTRTLRFAFGFVVAVILIPVLAIALPGVFGEQLSSVTDDIGPQVQEPFSSAAPDGGAEPAQATSRLVPPIDPIEVPATPPTSDSSSSTSTANSEGDESTTTTAADTTTKTAAGTTTSTIVASTTPTTATSTTPTTVAPPTTAATPASAQSDGDITGVACPCTVTGTVVLKGNISLQGDLVVDGGKLIARPGVDLQGNGYQIMFIKGGRADFQGTPVFTWSGDGSNANLERDINFRNLRRIIFLNEPGSSILKFFTVSDSGTPTLGDYPLHWHLNGNSSRGTIVEGVVVLNGANHAFVPHGSNGITFKDTIAKNISGDAYWWDPPGTNESCSFQKFCTRDNSNDITFDHALAYLVTNANGSRGFRLAGFRLGAGAGNVIRNSAATNISPSNIKDCAGFHWPESANGNTGGNVWKFINNRSSSVSGCHGIFVWQNDGNPHVIDGFTGGGIDHGAYSNQYVYKNIDVPYFQVHAAGLRVTSGRIDTVYTRGHRNASVPTAIFEDVSINRFVIQNGNGELPGYYVLNNTGLGCDDIEYELVFAGTTVVIDGVECGS